MHNKLLLILLLIAPTLRAGIYTAPNASFPAVNGAMTQRMGFPGVTCQPEASPLPNPSPAPCVPAGTNSPMVDGDTLLIPVSGASAVDWSGQHLNITKHIQIIGFGEDIQLPIDTSKSYKSDMLHATPNPTKCTLINIDGTTKIITTALSLVGRDFPTRISGLVFNFTAAPPPNTGYRFELRGQAYRHRHAGLVKGGLRWDHVRLRNNGTTNDFGGLTYLWSTKDGDTLGAKGNYITGSFDHNFTDFTLGTKGNEVNTFGTGGSPGNVTPNGYGQWDWNQTFTYGAGDTSSSGVDDNGDAVLPEIYIEDNIWHRGGHDFGTLGGGGRLVIRHNTAWGTLNHHGFESGNSFGPASVEQYNNWQDGTIIPYGGAALSDWRGGADVLFNNRMTGPAFMNLQMYRISFTGTVVGPADGKNFFDENETGTINVNGHSFAPVAPTPSDSRVGVIYAKGTGITKIANYVYDLTGLDGSIKGLNGWKDFVLINADTSAPEVYGGPWTPAQNQSADRIQSSSIASPCRVTLQAGHDAVFPTITGAGTHWEIRKVKTYYGLPGTGKIPQTLNGGNSGGGPTLIPSNNANPELNGTAYLNASGGKNKYWSNPAGWGLFQWGNKVRSTPSLGSPSFLGSFPLQATDPIAHLVPGGVNDNTVPSNNVNTSPGLAAGTAYPEVTPAPTPYKTVGAEWDAPGYTETIRAGGDMALTGYGSEYPNTMISGAVTAATPVISSAGQDTFTVGQFRAFPVTVSNFSGTSQTFSLVSSSPPSNIILDTGAGCSTPQPTPPAGQSWAYLCGIAATNTDLSSPYTLHIRASQSSPTAQQADQTDFQLFVVPSSSAVTPVITNSPTPLTATAQVGTSFSYTITASNTPTSYSASGLPSGLSVNTSTGVISGTPAVGSNASSPYTVTLGATNSAGTGNATLTITVVGSSTPVVTSASSATGTVGSSFSYQITASNSPTSYSATSLPSGLSVNTTTGVISGIPTAVGLTNVTIGATNSSGTGTKVLALTVQTGIASPTPAVIQIIP